jgi:hypothetical protein
MRAGDSGDRAVAAVESAAMSLRTIFAVTSSLAVLCAAMAFPSEFWLTAFALGNICVAVYAAQRAVIAPNARALWLSYLAGVGAFCAVISCFKLDPVDKTFVSPLHRMFHGPVSPFSADGLTTYRTFAATVELVLMFALPVTVAYAMTFFVRKQAGDVMKP